MVIEWTGEHAQLMRLDDGAGFPLRKRPVELVVVHQSAGAHVGGEQCARDLRAHHMAPPIVSNGRVIGGGLGLPGCAHAFVVPSWPAVAGGKLVVYRLVNDERVTPHTGGHLFDRLAVSVCFAGDFQSRHALPVARARQGPSPESMLAASELIIDYLLPRYGVGVDDGLVGHFDLGCPACPGDELEQWIRHMRGDRLSLTPAQPQLVHRRALALDTAQARQQALIDLGYAAPNTGTWDEASKSALLSFQAAVGLPVDGHWGAQTDGVIRDHLGDGHERS